MERDNPDGDRALIAAILDQAFSDALNRDRFSDPVGARRFIDDKNKVFRIYCELLDMEPEYVACKMQARLRKHDLKPLMEFRK